MNMQFSFISSKYVTLIVKTIKYYECYSKSSLVIYRIFVETNILTETNKYIFVDKL